jgi:hypothetical protein
MSKVRMVAFVVVTFILVVNLFPFEAFRSLLPAPLSGPILDARFMVGPLDPEPINGTCPVHHITLEEDIVRIVYGLLDLPEDEFESRQEGFPFANSRYLGGCCVQEPRRARVLFCQECRENEKEWMRRRGIRW